MSLGQDCQHEEEKEEVKFSDRGVWHLLRDYGKGNGHITMFSSFLSQLPKSMVEHINQLPILPS
jgi:glycerophosphoryl diester phosphodiesterase